MPSPKEILKQYWGYDSFRPLQEDIIQSVLSGKDTLALLPTGGGKSICFQVPALMKEGVCLVVSPLVALMKDQVNQLKHRHIKAAYLTSDMHHTQIEQVLNQCQYGNTKILYISPERLKSRTFVDHLRNMKLSMLAVDEAHCISQWGYDFRPSYLEIDIVREFHPRVPIIALTATATPEVVEDICRCLRFRGKNIFRQSFFRKNLAYMAIRDEDKRGRLIHILKTVNGSAIIYVRNRRRTQEIAQLLNNNGIPAEAYHAGMSQKERDTKQAVWTKSNRCIMVATNAFGMGIDKPDVRLVIHLDIPAFPEAYFQEAGRAGRDGQKAYAILLYEESDRQRLVEHVEQQFPPLNQIRNVYKAICNYYQIPVGSGASQRYDFDMEKLCDSYQLSPLLVFNATRFLEREGLIELPQRNETHSEVYAPISKEELYRFQVESSRYGDMITTMLRLYGGIFTDFTTISENEIARRCQTTPARVEDALSKLDKQGILSYKKKANKPQIIFLQPRIDTNSLYISQQNYAQLKETAIKRRDQMMAFVNDTTTCRSQLLCAYFGEKLEEECHICDICLTRNSNKEKNSIQKSSLRETIINELKKQQLTIKELSGIIDPMKQDDIATCIQELLDDGLLQVDSAFRLSLSE